jgi:hypothetical protein
MGALGTWLANFLVGILEPILTKWWNAHQASQTVAANATQLNAIIKSVSVLQTAKTPQDFENDIKALGAADNANSQ